MDDETPAGGRAPAIRASDAEREQTITVLQTAAGEGRIDFEELADRIAAAQSSRTRDELAQITADLPDAAHAAAAVAERPADAVQKSVFGDLRRSGRWRLPAKSRWDTVFGDVVLDLRQAVIESAGTVEIDAGTVFGDVTILVPEGVRVVLETRTFFGDNRQSAGHEGGPGAPVVIVSGGTWFGDVKVQNERLRERAVRAIRAEVSPRLPGGDR